MHARGCVACAAVRRAAVGCCWRMRGLCYAQPGGGVGAPGKGAGVRAGFCGGEDVAVAEVWRHSAMASQASRGAQGLLK